MTNRLADSRGGKAEPKLQGVIFQPFSIIKSECVGVGVNPARISELEFCWEILISFTFTGILKGKVSNFRPNKYRVKFHKMIGFYSSSFW